jgi:hypothetical protein
MSTRTRHLLVRLGLMTVIAAAPTSGFNAPSVSTGLHFQLANLPAEIERCPLPPYGYASSGRAGDGRDLSELHSTEAREDCPIV